MIGIFLWPSIRDQTCLRNFAFARRGRAATLRGGRHSRRAGAARHRADLPRLRPAVEGCRFFGVHEGGCEFLFFPLPSAS
jgi:hypothetical protein